MEAAKVLIEHGANVNARENWHGETALMWAAAQKHPAMLKELIAHGADVNAMSTVIKWERQVTAEPREKWLPLGGFTPLMFAAREGCVACLPILADAGANLNQADPDGITPMVNAIMNGHYDVARFLLDKGADPNLADKTGRTVLYAAVDAHTVPASNRPSPDDSDNETSSLELVKATLAHGGDVNKQLTAQIPYRTKVDRGNDTMLTTGTTPLIRAAKAGDAVGHRASARKRRGPETRHPQRHQSHHGRGRTGLQRGRRRRPQEDGEGSHRFHRAAAEGRGDGDAINAVDSKGDTALHGAAQKGWNQIVQYLADHGAKLDVKDKKGLTPVDAAMGLEGGLGFDGATGDVHESTAALLKQLIAAKSH